MRLQAGTLFRRAVDVLRSARGRAAAGGLRAPLTAREIAQALTADKATQATRKQAIDQPGSIFSALRKRNGGMVLARWSLAGPDMKEATEAPPPLNAPSFLSLPGNGRRTFTSKAVSSAQKKRPQRAGELRPSTGFPVLAARHIPTIRRSKDRRLPRRPSLA
jgi:hypothetical protein